MRGRPRSGSRHPDAVEDLLELGTVVPLASGHKQGQRLLPLLDRQMHLGVSPPRERPRPWSSGSVSTPPGGSFWRPPFTRPGGVLMSAGNGGVHADIPRDQAFCVGLGLQLFEDSLPGAVTLPPPEQVVGPVPRSVALREVPPRSAGPGPPPYAIDQLPMRPGPRTARLLAHRQQWLQPLPLAVRQITTSHGP